MKSVGAPKETFPKELRICKKKEFEVIFNCGKKVFHKGLVVYLHKNTEKNITRIGIIVSRKAQKSAVLRNKFKRRIREIFRKARKNLKQGYDILVVATKISVLEEYKTLLQKLCELLKQEGLWDEENSN